MRRTWNLLGGLLSLAVMGIVLVLLVLLFWALDRQPQVAQPPYPVATQTRPVPPAPSTPPLSAYPAPLTITPLPTAIPLSTSTPSPWTTIYPTVPPPLPTPTLAPPRPTPVVTAIPTAQPPIIPLPPGPTKLYTIAFRDGNVIRAMNSDGANVRVLVDIQAHLPLFLASEDPGYARWGSPSPDGSQLALVLMTAEDPRPPNKGEPPPRSSIYMFDRDKGSLRELVQDGVEPVWSPDGTRIAYRNTQTRGLWIVNVATGEAREIYPIGGLDRFAIYVDWAPDGQRLVFVDEVFRQSTAIVVIDSDGLHATTLRASSEFHSCCPRWSPDGSKILFVSLAGERSGPEHAYNLWMMNPDGTNQTQLTRDIDLEAPRWSPDGRWIAFPGTRFYEEPKPLTDLWLVDSTGSVLERLTSNVVESANDFAPAWSPDGTQLTFMKEHVRGEGMSGPKEVWALSLADGVQKRLPPLIADFIILP